jgi:hypothetical protein
MHSASIPLIIAARCKRRGACGCARKSASRRLSESLWKIAFHRQTRLVNFPRKQSRAHEDFTLGGVSPIPGGYRVTVFPKTGNLDRILLDSGETASRHRNPSVEFNAADPLDTVVYLKSGGLTAPLRFDRQARSTPSRNPPRAKR